MTYTTLLCLLISLVSASSFEISSTTWSNAYVSKDLLSLTGVQRETITATSNLRCGFLATTKTWANLYCFLKMENECVITELLRAPSDDSTGLQDPVLCKTRFTEKGAFLCAKRPNISYKGYGCLLHVPLYLTWANARVHCQNRGMDLASFESITSKSELNTVAADIGLVPGYWYFLGILRVLPDTKFYWFSGPELKTDGPLWGQYFGLREPSSLYLGLFEHLGMLVAYDGLHDLAGGSYHCICSFP